MDFVFVFCGNEWEDITILLSEEDAINKSKNYPNNRVEIFKNNNSEFIPTYNYYKNGILYSFQT